MFALGKDFKINKRNISKIEKRKRNYQLQKLVQVEFS